MVEVNMNKKWFYFIITNFITFLRVIGIFALIPVYKNFGGLACFLLSSFCFLTDCLDGLLARKLQSSTFFGSLFDALSDKAFLVVNMFLLMSMTEFAIIPILLELSIAMVQSYKYEKQMNIQANIIGKTKMWVAGICISLSYILLDQRFISSLGLLGNQIKQIPETGLLSIVLVPLVLSEIVTLISYIVEYFGFKHQMTIDCLQKKAQEEEKIMQAMREISLKDLMFNHKYYEIYKDQGNLKLIRSLAKRNKEK